MTSRGPAARVTVGMLLGFTMSAPAFAFDRTPATTARRSLGANGGGIGLTASLRF